MEKSRANFESHAANAELVSIREDGTVSLRSDFSLSPNYAIRVHCFAPLSLNGCIAKKSRADCYG